MSKKNRNHHQEQQEQEVQNFVEDQQAAETYEEETTEEVVEDVQEEATEEAVEEVQEETPATSNTGTMDSVIELDSETKEVKEVPVSGDAYHDSFVRSEVDRRAEERLRLMR